MTPWPCEPPFYRGLYCTCSVCSTSTVRAWAAVFSHCSKILEEKPAFYKDQFLATFSPMFKDCTSWHWKLKVWRPQAMLFFYNFCFHMIVQNTTCSHNWILYDEAGISGGILRITSHGCDEAGAGWVKAHCKKRPWPGIGDGKIANLFLQCKEPVVLRLQSVAEKFSPSGTRTCVQHIKGSMCMCNSVH